MMKKGLMYICLLTVLTGMTAVTSLQAQILTRYKATIPFDFKIGQKSYKAGEYFASVRNSTTGVEWSFSDSKAHCLQIRYILMNGEPNNGNTAKLLFYSYQNQLFLTDMETPDFSLKIGNSKVDKIFTEKSNPQKTSSEVTSVLLNK